MRYKFSQNTHFLRFTARCRYPARSQQSLKGADMPQNGLTLADKVEAFVREVVIPYEKDPRRDSHGPTDDLVLELRDKARQAGVLTPHIRPDGSHLSQRDTALVLKRSALSPLGPLACNTMAP